MCRMTRYRCVSAGLAVIGLFAVPANLASWGGLGHRLIARVATSKLSEGARGKVDELLAGKGLAAVATWADDTIPIHADRFNWHFVRIPRSAGAYRAERDCVANRRGECLVKALEAAVMRLRDSSQVVERREALMYVIHLVGDVHQPFHCVDSGDQFGNAAIIRLPLNGSYVLSTRHTAWDSDLLTSRGYSEDAYLSMLSAQPSVKQSVEPNFADWATECHRVALAVGYLLPQEVKAGSEPVLDGDQLRRAQAAVDRQLILAGSRLAALINRIFGR